jgi:hypothetical protein
MGPAVRLAVKAHLRREVLGLVGLMLAVSVAGGFVLTVAQASRRTDSAWDRLLVATRSPHYIAQMPLDQYAEVASVLESEPGVAAVGAMSYMGVGPEGWSIFDQVGAFTGVAGGFLDTVYAPRILRGRAARPERADEITINEAMADLTGLDPGDHVHLVSQPAAVDQDATVVGVHRAPFELAFIRGGAIALLTPAFGERWYRPYQVAGAAAGGGSPDEAVVMALVRVQADADAAMIQRDLLAAVPDAPALGDLQVPEITAALGAQSRVDAVLASVGGLTALLVLSQVAVRQRRARQVADPELGALGLTARTRLLIAAAPSALAIVAGAGGAALASYLASGLVPTGLGAQVEPDLGRAFEPLVHLAGPAALGVILLAVVLAPGWRAAARRSRTILPAVPGGPARLVGWRAATGWAERAGRRSALSTAVGTAVATTGMAGLALPDGGTFPTEVTELVERKGSILPRIVAGRVPVGPAEVLVGPRLLRDADIELGDTIVLAGQPVEVVGIQVAPQPGNGSFGSTVTVLAESGTFTSEDPVPIGARVLFNPSAGHDVSEVLAVTGGVGETPSPPPTIANLDAIGRVDDVLVAFGAAVGLCGLLSGLLALARARRRDLAVLGALGAGVRSSLGALGFMAGVLALGGVLAGVPVGLASGRMVWRGTARSIAVVEDFTVDWLPVVGVAAAFLTTAALVALGVALTRAVRGGSQMLRAE